MKIIYENCRVEELFESCTGIVEVKGSNPVQAGIFPFRNCKSCVYSCDDLLSYNSSSIRHATTQTEPGEKKNRLE